MGLGESDPSNEKGIGGGGGVTSPLVPCSICREALTDCGDRSTAKLLCGHQFHLDCIGSAFNAKGVMQCPNCKKVEKGNWLYANGYHSLPDLSMDDWTHEEDLYDLNYSEMPYGVHWCPFSRLARVPSPFESTSRTSSSVVSSMVPAYHGSSRAQARAHELHTTYQHHNTQSIRGPIFSGVQRSGGMRGMAPVGPVSSPSDHSGFYLYPPSGSSGRGSQVAESTGGNHFYAWERDLFAPFPLVPVDRESAWWGPFPQATGPLDSSSRTGFWHRHGSERSSSQGPSEVSSYRPVHLPRIHPFI